MILAACLSRHLQGPNSLRFDTITRWAVVSDVYCHPTVLEGLSLISAIWLVVVLKRQSSVKQMSKYTDDAFTDDQNDADSEENIIVKPTQ